MDKPTPEQSEDKPSRPKRPFPVKLLIVIFAFWGLIGWLRFFRTLIERDLVFEYLSEFLFGYLLGTGMVLGLVALLVVVGLLWRSAWAKGAAWIAAVLIPGVLWFERLVLWRDESFQDNWGFLLLLSLLWFGLVCWALCAKTGREYFFTVKKGKT